jgi:hypothetical protein
MTAVVDFEVVDFEVVVVDFGVVVVDSLVGV